MIGVIVGTPLGEALAHRLRDDQREITTNLQEMARAHLIVVDAAPQKLREVGRALGDVTDGTQLIVHTVRGLVAGAGAWCASRLR